MEVTEAPSVHRATELVCQFYQQFIYKAFTSKQLSRICTLHLRRSLCRRHLRDIAFTSVPFVNPCAYYIRLLVYHSRFRKNRSCSFEKNIAESLRCLLYYHPTTTGNLLILILQNTDCVLKNNYILSNKTAINKDNNTHKKQVCNQQEINWL